MDTNEQRGKAILVKGRTQKLSTEVELEEVMVEVGKEHGEMEIEKRKAEAKKKADLRNAKLESLIRPFDVMSDHMLSAVHTGIIEFVQDAFSGKAGRNVASAKYLSELSPEKMAVAACMGTLNAMLLGETQTRCAMAIAGYLEDDTLVSMFFEQNPGAARWVNSEVKKRKASDRKRQKKFFASVAKHKGNHFQYWSVQRKQAIGRTLLSIFEKRTGWVNKTVSRVGKKTITYIYCKYPLEQLVAQSALARFFMRPAMLPMFEPPVPWTALSGGAYHTEDLKMDLVKGWATRTATARKMRVLQLKRLTDMAVPYAAVSALDATPFRVNGKVKKVMDYFYSQGIEVGSMPGRQELIRPEFPEEAKGDKAKLTEKQKELRVVYRKQCAKAHADFKANISKRSQVYRVLLLAEEYMTKGSFYFPHQLDFRGRVYDVPSGLNPQGPDFARSLLEFAVAKPVDTDDALRWLQVHGANCYGKDKCSMADRIQWVKESFKEIRKVARDPLKHTWWMDADKPWSFLAWCFDYMGVLKGEPSRVAVALDGSCNGLQHLSAMLRDPVGAKAVNLSPSPLPQDIYQQVADVVIQDLKKEKSGKKREWARAFIASGIIDRKLCKRSVMVMPYGGKMKSTRDYVEDGVRDALILTDLDAMFGDDQVKAIFYLAEMVHAATRKVVKKAAIAMAWLQDVASVASKAGVHLHWKVPHGFVVTQVYTKKKRVRIDLMLDGRRIQDRLNQDTDDLDPHKSRNGISPNLVHSLDACAMMMTVTKAKRQGVDHFRMVHDDYGTHAADTEVLSRCLREAFVELYRDNDILGQFLEQVKAQLPEKYHASLPPLPEKGSFDIEDVLRSEFFFA